MNPRTPTALRVLAGNPSKRPLPQNEPQPERGAEMPDWLSEEAKIHWDVVSKQLDDVGVLTKMDAVALGLYCEAFARWKHANDQVIKFGPVVKAPSGFPVQSPFLSIANKAWEQMLRILMEFGMTPASRSRVTAAKQEDEESQYRRFAS